MRLLTSAAFSLDHLPVETFDLQQKAKLMALRHIEGIRILPQQYSLLVETRTSKVVQLSSSLVADLVMVVNSIQKKGIIGERQALRN